MAEQLSNHGNAFRLIKTSGILLGMLCLLTFLLDRYEVEVAHNIHFETKESIKKPLYLIGTMKTVISSDSHKELKTYLIPLSGKPDPVPSQRVMETEAFQPISQTQEEFATISIPQLDGSSTSSNNEHCRVTSQIKIYRRDLEAKNSLFYQPDWRLVTLDMNGQEKFVGGDEFLIAFEELNSKEPTAIANITDQGDGNYTLHFVRSPTMEQLDDHYVTSSKPSTTRGTLRVFLEHSCGLGTIPPPVKNNWTTSGAINQQYIISNISSPQVIETFVQPNSERTIDLGQYDRVVVCGDSLFGQFASQNNNHLTLKQNMYKSENVHAPLNSKTIVAHFVNHIREDIKEVYKDLEEERGVSFGSSDTDLSDRVIANNNVRIALVVGSGVWDILADDNFNSGVDFENHAQACRDLISSIQQEFPQVEIYWKSMTAMHVHSVSAVKNWSRIKRVFYMSNSRARRLYQLQKQIMNELSIPILDVYAATYFAPHKTRFGDGRHYQASYNKIMTNWFYPRH